MLKGDGKRIIPKAICKCYHSQVENIYQWLICLDRVGWTKSMILNNIEFKKMSRKKAPFTIRCNMIEDVLLNISATL